MAIRVDIRKRMESGASSFRLRTAFESHEDFVVIFGPSGAGKTLTLRAVAGLLTPDEGCIEVGGRVLFDSQSGVDVPARLRRIGYLFQDYALFPHLTVRENVEFGLNRDRLGRSSQRGRERARELLEIFEIAGLENRHPRSLSGGQRQRTALARALAPRPDLLLLDEPFAALDTFLRGKLRRELLVIQARFGIPVLMITHDPEDVRALAKTVVCYEAGEVASVVDVADYLAAVNRFAGADGDGSAQNGNGGGEPERLRERIVITAIA